jgi:hypothetical protein
MPCTFLRSWLETGAILFGYNAWLASASTCRWFGFKSGSLLVHTTPDFEGALHKASAEPQSISYVLGMRLIDESTPSIYTFHGG